MVKNPIPQQIYRHFKGKLYQIISLAEHSETGEMLVIYQALYGEFKIYARPLSMFMEKVDKEKYPDATQEYRFELQGSAGGAGAEIEQEKAEADSEQAEAVMNSTQRTVKPAAEQNVQNLIQDSVSCDTQEQNQEALEEGEYSIDPLVLEFLDAGSYEERLNILAALHHRITDDMINTMAVAIDVEVNEGDIEQRYAELRNCLLLFDKFECSRLR